MLVDLMIVSLIILGTYMGYKKGIVRQLFNIFAMIVGSVISIIFTSRLAFLLSEIIPYENSQLAMKFKDTLAGLDVSEGYYKIIAFFLIFFIVKFALQIIANSLGLITKLPVIKTANKLLGGLLGFIEVYLIIFGLLYLAYFLPFSLEFFNKLNEATLPVIILDKTPIISELVFEEFFNYIKNK